MNSSNTYDKVLLTGSAGFLGGIIRSYLEKEGARVLGLDMARAEIIKNITQPFELDSDLSVGMVIHAAGKAHSIPRTPAEEKVFYDVNYEGTKNLCTALEKLAVRPKSLVFISTVAVYGVDRGVSIAETHPLNGTSPYAKSKILAEQFLREWTERTGINVGILRLPLIAGPNPPGNLGAMLNGIKTGKYLSIGKADARKSVVWIDDIPRIIPVLAEVGGTYNITDGYHPSFGELELVMSKALSKGKPIAIPVFVAKLLGIAGDILGDKFPLNTDKLKKITSTLTFDDSLARKRLNWTPARVLDKLPEAIS